MVQRKAPNLKHLSIQPHHLKPEDVRNRSSVADLKTKKMKKSGSIKRPELNSPRTPKPTKQPTKPTKTPNYMKSTSSSDARKDQSRAGADTATPRRRCSNSNSSKHTSCKNSAAKKASLKALTKNLSFKPARTSSSLVKKCSRAVLCEDLDVKRATCSSTLKDCKFPAYLSLNPGGTELEGTSAVKICPYTYCSLNGHHHAPVPPLKSFLSAKRRMIKAQRSFKLGCLSPRRAKPVIQNEEEEEKNDFFVEIYTKENESIAENIEITEMDLEQNEKVEADEVISPELSIQEETKMGVESNVQSYEIDSEASEMDSETGFYSALFLDYAYEYSTEAENIEPDPEAERDETESHISNNEFMINKSDNKDGCFDDFLVDDASQESYEMSLNSFEFSSNEDGESVASYDDLQNLNSMKNSAEPEISPSDEDFTNLSRVDSTQDKDHMDHKVKAENQEEVEENSLLTLARGKSKKPIDESDELGAFNPREPNFLPIEPDPESEKVNLKHQDLDETKNTEEWMVDYALRQAVTKLGPARKKKVALLVEAFEKVMPITKWDIQTRHNTSMFDQARPMQACS